MIELTVKLDLEMLMKFLIDIFQLECCYCDTKLNESSVNITYFDSLDDLTLGDTYYKLKDGRLVNISFICPKKHDKKYSPFDFAGELDIIFARVRTHSPEFIKYQEQFNKHNC